MALSIKDEELDRRVRRLAKLTGTTFTASIRLAVDNELARREAGRDEDFQAFLAKIRTIQHRVAERSLPNPPSENEIMGWDEHGLPS